jgi:hypothetical protein
MSYKYFLQIAGYILINALGIYLSSELFSTMFALGQYNESSEMFMYTQNEVSYLLILFCSNIALLFALVYFNFIIWCDSKKHDDCCYCKFTDQNNHECFYCGV